jgi:microcystin-dependent protein
MPIFMTAMLLLLLTVTPSVSYAESCETPIECYAQAIQKLREARAEIEALKSMATKVEKRLAEYDSICARIDDLSSHTAKVETTQQLDTRLITAQKTADMALGKVGDIKFSVLSEAQFQKIHGQDWILINGRNLPKGNPLRKLTGWTKLPDARGRFFRMKDYGTGIDASGDKSVGTLLNDMTGKPKVNFTTNTTGSHTHSMQANGNHNHSMKAAENDQYGYGLALGSLINSWRYKRMWYYYATTEPASADTDSIEPAGTHTHTINNAPAHSHVINGGGDKETRPKNIIINAFIKIR